jgi:hypothetical protein
MASDAMKGRSAAPKMNGARRRIDADARWGIEPLGDNGGYVQQIDSGRCGGPRRHYRRI